MQGGWRGDVGSTLRGATPCRLKPSRWGRRSARECGTGLRIRPNQVILVTIVGTPTVTQNTLAMPAYHECGASYLTRFRHRLAVRTAMRGMCLEQRLARCIRGRIGRAPLLLARSPVLAAGSRHAGLDQRICSQRDEFARRTGRRQLQLDLLHQRIGCPSAGHRDACTPSPHDTLRSMNERRRPTRRGRGHRPPNRPPLTRTPSPAPIAMTLLCRRRAIPRCQTLAPAPSSDGGDAGIRHSAAPTRGRSLHTIRRQPERSRRPPATSPATTTIATTRPGRARGQPRQSRTGQQPRERQSRQRQSRHRQQCERPTRPPRPAAQRTAPRAAAECAGLRARRRWHRPPAGSTAARDGGFIRRAANSYLADRRATPTCRRTSSGSSRSGAAT